MQAWKEYALHLVNQAVDGAWLWFDSLNRQEWLIVLFVCCLCGFLFMKSWGRRGPC